MTALWGAIGQYDTALGVPHVLQNVWSWVSSPWGFFPLFALGLVVIMLAVWQPQFIWKRRPSKSSVEALADKLAGFEGIPDQLQDHERRLTNFSEQLTGIRTSNSELEKDKPRWEHTEADLHNLESEFRRYGERLVDIERQLGSIAEKVNPQPTFDSVNVKNQVIVTYQSASLDLSGISRTLTLWCIVKNVSAAWIWPTYQVAGHLIYEAYRLVSTRWEVEWQPPMNLDPMGSARLGLIFHVDQRLAEDLAFKAEDGEFHSDLSELQVEFMARDAKFRQVSIGWLHIGEKQTVRIEDGVNASRIRAYVNWRESQF